MNKTIFLSRALGIYFLIVSIAMLINMDLFKIQVNLLIHDTPLMFVTGFFTVILGILLVLTHNSWRWNGSVIITVIAWITLIKGCSIFFFPALLNNLTMIFLQTTTCAYVAAVIDFALGIYLIYYGFKKPKKVKNKIT